MKVFLRGLLTIWLFVLLVVFGIIINVKSVLVNTTDVIIKKEIKENVVTIVEKLDEEVPKDVITKIEKQIDENKKLKKIMDNYYDQIIKAFGNNGTIQIEIEKQLETLIDNSEDILKEYNIIITEETKKEMLNTVSSSEINEIVNDSISEAKSNMSDDVKTVLDIYVFATSLTFKMILVGLMLVTIVMIAFLKKSYFKWLSNFGVSSTLAGMIFAIVLPTLVSALLMDIIQENNMVIDLMSFHTYGYILIGIGILSIILNIVIPKLRVNN